jgi:putative transposase
VTIRCNNREFKLIRHECRQVLLYALTRYCKKFSFKLYGMCIMSNHVHYLIEPQQPDDLPKIMHGLNWYTAMCFNRMLNRTGHFWEKRYFCTGFANTDRKRALNTLRYIHANPKAAGIGMGDSGFFYDFSNYGVYDRLTDDGLTQWHPAFLALGATLDICAAAYRAFCRKYRPKPKPEIRNHWGKKLLAGLLKCSRGQPKKTTPGQMSLWRHWQATNPEIRQVAEQFVRANALNPEVAISMLYPDEDLESSENQENSGSSTNTPSGGECQVSNP